MAVGSAARAFGSQKMQRATSNIHYCGCGALWTVCRVLARTCVHTDARGYSICLLLFASRAASIKSHCTLFHESSIKLRYDTTRYVFGAASCFYLIDSLLAFHLLVQRAAAGFYGRIGMQRLAFFFLSVLVRISRIHCAPFARSKRPR